jgi:hypothetical protein
MSEVQDKCHGVVWQWGGYTGARTILRQYCCFRTICPMALCAWAEILMPLQFAFSVLEVLGSLLEIYEMTSFFKHIRRENRSLSI